MLENYESDAYIVALRDYYVDSNDNSSDNCVENYSSAEMPDTLYLFVSSRGYQDWKTKRCKVNRDMIKLIEDVCIIGHYDRFCKCLLIVNWISFHGVQAILPNMKEIYALLRDSDPSNSKISKASLSLRGALLMKMVTYY